MKFLAICGSGLGSSFMVQMNIEKILKQLNVSDVTVEHSDVSSVSNGMADVIFMAKDVAQGVNLDTKVVVLDSIIDQNELMEKVTKVCEELNLI